MALSVLVRFFTGDVVSEFMSPAIGSLCRLASERDLPFLGTVDIYDDTIFNRLHIPRIQGELESLLGSCGPGEGQAIAEILKIAECILKRPRHYLLFNGDQVRSRQRTEFVFGVVGEHSEYRAHPKSR